jgi:hypothetical protein
VTETCHLCEEPILPWDERGDVDGPPVHRECVFRLAGGVGHWLGICHCNGCLGLWEDPPGMNRREAAWAALAVYRFRGQYGTAREPCGRCPRCGAVSYHPCDVIHAYCSRCRSYYDRDDLPPGMIAAARAKAEAIGLVVPAARGV